MEHGDPLYSLIPLPDFKAILGIDDREDALSRYCLVTAAFTIEQYCKRRLLRRKHTDYLTFSGDHILGPDGFIDNYDFFGPHAMLPNFRNRLTGSPAYLGVLREYPVRKVLSVHAATAGTALMGQPLFGADSLMAPEHYYCLPEPSTDAEGGGSPLDEGIYEDIPFSLILRPPLRLSRKEGAIKVRYSAGYLPGKAPPDMASACLELAAWNMSRYRGRRIGMTGAIRGKGQDGEHLEPSLPENVRQLLEPYKRRVI